DADTPPRPGEHERDAEREQHLEGHEDPDQPERVPDRRPDLRVAVEQVAVVPEADPLRRRQQVVVREREVGAPDDRIGEEEREAGEPGAHQEQDEPAAAPRSSAPGSPAIDWASDRAGRRVDHGGPPPPACAFCASICLSSCFSPSCRFLTLPAWYLTVKRLISDRFAFPAAVIGAVVEYLLLKIRMKVAKFLSGFSSLAFAELRDDGAFLI